VIRTLVLSGVAALSLAAAADAQPMNRSGAMQGPGQMNGAGAMHGDSAIGGQTTDFITKAAQSDEFERREGRLAEQRSHNPHVKKFAAMMVSDHTKTTEGLKTAIRQAGMTPPPPPVLRDDQVRMMDDLKGMHGRDFDKAYIDQQVQAHQDALTVMQTYAQNGRPGPIRNAAAKTARLVQRHLDIAREIQRHLGG
jgi:putative membrane protein